MNSNNIHETEETNILGNETSQYLTFTINNENYGVEVMLVSEIKGWIKPTRLPNVPKYLLGVLNLRGIIVPIFDLRERFGLGLTEVSEKHATVFFTLDNRTIGVLVDAVTDIINVTKSQVKLAPEMEGEVHNEFLYGLVELGNKVIVLLDVTKIFEDINKTQITAI